jgi:type I restriction-modification system DNA methylase subunit
MTNPIAVYVAEIEKDYRGKKATELTYRSSLEKLIESLAHGIEASSDPKHIDCGAPDFVVEKRRVPLGYVETKIIGDTLDKVEKSDQLKRYRKALHNLILTDYLEFRWYVNGEKRSTVTLAEIGRGERLEFNPQAEQNLRQLFSDFYATETPTVRTPKELASRLAGVTHFIRDRIVDVLKSGEPSLQNAFRVRLTAFKELLLPALKEEGFADLYAQTMTYGLFAAKLSAPEEAEFTLTSAYQYLFTNKFLRRLFSDVSEELDEIEIIRPYLLDIVSLLNRADFQKILAEFGRQTRTEDPVVHFYETFLAAYDPKLRESRGVYYTPEPVVRFIVNSVHQLLKKRFGLSWGLADSSVKVLDPATGTGTFLYYTIQKIYDEIVATRKQAGQWRQKSKELLGRIFGFEVLIAPYVVAHLKLGLLLKTLDAPLEGKDERLRIFLTNTLEEGVTRAEQLAGLGHYIAEEASDAANVKKQQDIMVVLGNPPYSKKSSNPSVDMHGKPNFIGKLLKDYYFVDGSPLGERNSKWLQNDYVKFIRFGEWRVDQTGHGILAFITDHSYLNNSTFRGMRQHLMTTFDEIYVLDLHGNSNKEEVAPDGSRDENVFDIQEGVAIVMAIKDPAKQKQAQVQKPAKVWHAEQWGTRISKYEYLSSHDLANVDWVELQPTTPHYLFIPQDIKLKPEYEQGVLVTEMFGTYASTVTTARNHFAMAFEPDSLVTRMKDLVDKNISDQEIRNKYDLVDVSYWRLSEAREELRKIKRLEEFVKPYCYRPFDYRYVYYHRAVCERLRSDVMKHMEHENLAFLTHRPYSPKKFTYAYCTTMIGDQNVAANKTGGGGNSFQFPLYLYTTQEETAGTLFALKETTRRVNLTPKFVRAIEAKLGMNFLEDSPSDLKLTFGPEDVFYYAYAVFHSPTYRQRYMQFLKNDFPRLPLTSDKDLFLTLVAKGKDLVGLHLLRSPELDEFVTTYPVQGSNEVDEIRFSDGNVWINDHQYFGGVTESVWEFEVGGYQICDKWLKDRQGRTLSDKDISNYQRIVVALKETIRLMEEIDQAIPGWPIE